jgi:hypothetical protein
MLIAFNGFELLHTIQEEKEEESERQKESSSRWKNELSEQKTINDEKKKEKFLPRLVLDNY